MIRGTCSLRKWSSALSVRHLLIRSPVADFSDATWNDSDVDDSFLRRLVHEPAPSLQLLLTRHAGRFSTRSKSAVVQTLLPRVSALVNGDRGVTSVILSWASDIARSTADGRPIALAVHTAVLTAHADLLSIAGRGLTAAHDSKNAGGADSSGAVRSSVVTAAAFALRQATSAARDIGRCHHAPLSTQREVCVLCIGVGSAAVSAATADGERFLGRGGGGGDGGVKLPESVEGVVNTTAVAVGAATRGWLPCGMGQAEPSHATASTALRLDGEMNGAAATQGRQQTAIAEPRHVGVSSSLPPSVGKGHALSPLDSGSTLSLTPTSSFGAPPTPPTWASLSRFEERTTLSAVRALQRPPNAADTLPPGSVGVWVRLCERLRARLSSLEPSLTSIIAADSPNNGSAPDKSGRGGKDVRSAEAAAQVELWGMWTPLMTCAAAALQLFSVSVLAGVESRSTRLVHPLQERGDPRPGWGHHTPEAQSSEHASAPPLVPTHPSDNCSTACALGTRSWLQLRGGRGGAPPRALRPLVHTLITTTSLRPTMRSSRSVAEARAVPCHGSSLDALSVSGGVGVVGVAMALLAAVPPFPSPPTDMFEAGRPHHQTPAVASSVQTIALRTVQFQLMRWLGCRAPPPPALCALASTLPPSLSIAPLKTSSSSGPADASLRTSTRITRRRALRTAPRTGLRQKKGSRQDAPSTMLCVDLDAALAAAEVARLQAACAVGAVDVAAAYSGGVSSIGQLTSAVEALRGGVDGFASAADADEAAVRAAITSHLRQHGRSPRSLPQLPPLSHGGLLASRGILADSFRRNDSGTQLMLQGRVESQPSLTSPSEWSDDGSEVASPAAPLAPSPPPPQSSSGSALTESSSSHEDARDIAGVAPSCELSIANSVATSDSSDPALALARMDRSSSLPALDPRSVSALAATVLGVGAPGAALTHVQRQALVARRTTAAALLAVQVRAAVAAAANEPQVCVGGGGVLFHTTISHHSKSGFVVAAETTNLAQARSSSPNAPLSVRLRCRRTSTHTLFVSENPPHGLLHTTASRVLCAGWALIAAMTSTLSAALNDVAAVVAAGPLAQLYLDTGGEFGCVIVARKSTAANKFGWGDAWWCRRHHGESNVRSLARELANVNYAHLDERRKAAIDTVRDCVGRAAALVRVVGQLFTSLAPPSPQQRDALLSEAARWVWKDAGGLAAAAVGLVLPMSIRSISHQEGHHATADAVLPSIPSYTSCLRSFGGAGATAASLVDASPQRSAVGSTLGGDAAGAAAALWAQIECVTQRNQSKTSAQKTAEGGDDITDRLFRMCGVEVRYAVVGGLVCRQIRLAVKNDRSVKSLEPHASEDAGWVVALAYGCPSGPPHPPFHLRSLATALSLGGTPCAVIDMAPLVSAVVSNNDLRSGSASRRKGRRTTPPQSAETVTRYVASLLEAARVTASLLSVAALEGSATSVH